MARTPEQSIFEVLTDLGERGHDQQAVQRICQAGEAAASGDKTQARSLIEAATVQYEASERVRSWWQEMAKRYSEERFFPINWSHVIDEVTRGLAEEGWTLQPPILNPIKSVEVLTGQREELEAPQTPTYPESVLRAKAAIEGSASPDMALSTSEWGKRMFEGREVATITRKTGLSKALPQIRKALGEEGKELVIIEGGKGEENRYYIKPMEERVSEVQTPVGSVEVTSTVTERPSIEAGPSTSTPQPEEPTPAGGGEK